MNLELITLFLRSRLNNDAEILLQSIDTPGTNQHFHVRVGEARYFLKGFVTNQLQVIDRLQQFALQTELAEQGLALRPIAISSDHTLWLENYLEAIHPSPDSDKFPGLLAESLWHIHNLKPSAPRLDLLAEWQRYSRLAGVSFNASDEKISSLLTVFDVKAELCFCHNDLHYSHLVLGEPNKILDWEYAAIGNRYFDLAACCLVNQLRPAHENNLADTYAHLSGIPTDKVLSGIKRLKPVVDFTNELWHNAYNNLS